MVEDFWEGVTVVRKYDMYLVKSWELCDISCKHYVLLTYLLNLLYKLTPFITDIITLYSKLPMSP